MNRSRRLLIEAHKFRKERRARAGYASLFDVVEEVKQLAVSLREVESEGLLVVDVFDDLEDDVCQAALHVIERRAGEIAALNGLVAKRLHGDKNYRRSLVRQIDDGVAASIANAVEERVFLGCREAIRRLALRPHEPAPPRTP